MAKKLFLGGKCQLFDNNGDPLNGGKVYFYEVGTSTPKDTYSDADLTTANPNPVTLDSAGRADIFLSDDYKVIVKDSSDTTIYTQDGGVNPVTSTTQGNYNLITNPSFEDDTNVDSLPDSWTVTTYSGGTSALDSADQRSGGKSMKFTSTGSGGGYMITDSFFEVNELRSIEVRFSIKSSVVDVRNFVEVLWYDNNQSLLSATTVYDESAANPTSWTDKRSQVAPVSGARYAKLRMYGCHSSDSTPGSTWYDDVVVSPADISNILSTTGDMLYASAAKTPSAMSVGDEGQILKSVSGVPAWSGLPIDSVVGLEISNNATDANNDIDIAAGSAADSTGAYTLTLSAMTKQLDASWAAGTNAGGLFSGTKAADTWYHVFLIRKDSDGSIDAGFDTSTTAANIPSGYTAYRMIGSFLTDSSGNILTFYQSGDRFVFHSQQLALNTTASTTEQTVSVQAPPDARAILHIHQFTTTASAVYTLVGQIEQTGNTPSISLHTIATSADGSNDIANNVVHEVEVDSSSNILYVSSSTTTSTKLRIAVIGFVHPRGKY
jgi:hypothetical protein